MMTPGGGVVPNMMLATAVLCAAGMSVAVAVAVAVTAGNAPAWVECSRTAAWPIVPEPAPEWSGGGREGAKGVDEAAFSHPVSGVPAF